MHARTYLSGTRAWHVQAYRRVLVKFDDAGGESTRASNGNQPSVPIIKLRCVCKSRVKCVRHPRRGNNYPQYFLMLTATYISWDITEKLYKYSYKLISLRSFISISRRYCAYLFVQMYLISRMSLLYASINSWYEVLMDLGHYFSRSRCFWEYDFPAVLYGIKDDARSHLDTLITAERMGDGFACEKRAREEWEW